MTQPELALPVTASASTSLPVTPAMEPLIVTKTPVVEPSAGGEVSRAVPVERERAIPPPPPAVKQDELRPPPEASPAPPRCLLEDFTRFSQSHLWKLMMSFYDRQGVESWAQGIVPHFITSNAFIAKRYSNVLRAFLRDATRSTSASPVR